MIHKILCTYRRDSILFLFDDSIYIYFFVLAVIVKSNFSNPMIQFENFIFTMSGIYFVMSFKIEVGLERDFSIAHHF